MVPALAPVCFGVGGGPGAEEVMFCGCEVVVCEVITSERGVDEIEVDCGGG